MRQFLFLAIAGLATLAQAQEILLKAGNSATVHAAMDTTVTCEAGTGATAKNQCFCEIIGDREHEFQYSPAVLLLVTPAGTRVNLEAFNYYKRGGKAECEKAKAVHPDCL